jgi:hypothetical protein
MPEEPKLKNSLEEEIKKQLTPEPTTDTDRSMFTQATNGPLKSLRTYQGDIEGVIGTKKTSIASIAIAEHVRREERGELFEPEQQSFGTELKNKSFATISIGLILLGFTIVGAGYIIKSLDFSTGTPPKTTVVTYSKKIDLQIASSTKQRFTNSILIEKKTQGNQVNTLVYFNTISADGKQAKIEDVFRYLAPKAPESFIRSLDDKYMIGVYSFDSNEPFIILTTNDYAQSYAGMLKWEENIDEDLGEIFSIPKNTGSSTKSFIDKAIQNKDLRILTDANRNTVLVYSFLDKNTILITVNEGIFSAILNKFITSQMVR